MKKVILSALFLLVIQVANAFTLHALRVEYEENPIGIDATSPFHGKCATQSAVPAKQPASFG